MGELYTFIHFDQNSAWFNLETSEEMEEVDVPANVRPGLKLSEFIFREDIHLLLTVRGEHSPTSTARMLKNILGRLHAKRFKIEEPAVDVVPVQAEEAMDEVWGLKRLKQLEIHITRINPDIFGEDFEEGVPDFFRETEADSITTIVKGESIKRNDQLDRAAGVALEEGYVRARGVNQLDATVELATRDHVKEKVYEAGAGLVFGILRRAAAEAKQVFLGRKNQT